MKIPANLRGADKDAVQDLFSIAYANRDTLISGVTNAYNASDVETFFYFNILPKLQVHGLADNQREVGVKYRRGFLNRGQALFAAVEKKMLFARSAKKDVANPGNSEKAEVVYAPEEKLAAPVTKKKQ